MSSDDPRVGDLPDGFTAETTTIDRECRDCDAPFTATKTTITTSTDRQFGLPAPAFCEDCEQRRRGVSEQEAAEQLRQDRAAAAARARQQLAETIPRIHHGATLESTIMRPGLRDRLKQWMGDGLFITGPTGTGKSYAIAALVYDVVPGRFQTVAWENPNLMLERVRRRIGRPTPKKTADAIEHLITADLAVLDDLGAEKPTEWAAARMYEVIASRHEQMRPTLITSNQSLNRIADRLNPEQGEPYGDRIASRIRQMVDQPIVIPPDAPDLRLALTDDKGDEDR